MTDVAIILTFLSGALTWALTRRHRDLAAVSALITVGLVVVAAGIWQ
jgi:hypothetical protein